jgi:hypothetical protein
MWAAVVGTVLVTFSTGFITGVWFVLSDAEDNR